MRSRASQCESIRTLSQLFLAFLLIFTSSDAAAEESSPAPDEGARIRAFELERYQRRVTEARGVLESLEDEAHRRHRLQIEEVYTPLLEESSTSASTARSAAIEALQAAVTESSTPPEVSRALTVRLAQLVYDDEVEQYIRDLVRFEDAIQESADGSGLESLEEPVRDRQRSLQMLRRLAVGASAASNIETLLFLLAMSLEEAREPDEALTAWRALACSNRFTYRVPERDDADDETASGETHPGASSPETAEASTPLANAYVSCSPVTESSRLEAVAWLRIGELHFEYDYSELALEHAIAAYEHVLECGETPYRSLALFRLARTLSRSDRIPEALLRFLELLSQNEDVEPFRALALWYIGDCLTETDWDGDFQHDETSIIDRLIDDALIPQDRDFTFDIYAEVADRLFETLMYPEAIEAYEIILNRWPLALEAPRFVAQIQRSHEQSREFDRASETRLRLTQYGADSRWAAEHRAAHPEQVRIATRDANEALLQDAQFMHVLGFRYRQRSLDHGEVRYEALAVDAYRRAAESYRRFLDQNPADPDRWTLLFSFAGASYFGGLHEQALQAYTEVRDNTDDAELRVRATAGVARAQRALDGGDETSPD